MPELLEEAEALEREAAAGRVAYLSSLAPAIAGPVLDVGCGNGYGVERWLARGHRAVGVDRSLYRLGRWAAERADRDLRRRAVIAEPGRVLTAVGMLVVDCPNGAFPVDFWHGDRIGAFRVHLVPDSLLPSHSDLLRWGAETGLEPRIEPLGDRLRFRQVRRRWWGRLLAPLAALLLRLLDRAVGARPGGRWARSWARLYPYVVVSYRRATATTTASG